MIWLNNYLKETAVSSAAQTRSSGASYPGIEQRVQVAVVLPSLNLMRLTNYRGIRRALTGKVCCGFFPPLKTKCPISSQMHLTDLNALKKKKAHSSWYVPHPLVSSVLFHNFFLHKFGFDG